jgi:tetratricopeptide (TPR) repeat protein/TolB-like protein
MARQLVMPFENSSTDPRAHWLTEASAVIITDDLLALGVPAIPRDDRLRAFERLRVPPVANLSHATVIKIGQILGAADVIVGRVDLDADRLTVRARTIRLDAGRMSEEIVEEGPLEDLFAIYARVARRIVPEPTVTLEEMEEDHPNPAAFEQYIKGLLAQAPPARVTYLTAALRLAPDFRRPRVALWAVHHDLGDHAAALAAVRAIPPGHRLSRQAQFLETVSMLYLGRYQEAFDRLSALNESGQDPALLNNLGIIQLRRPASGTGGRAVSYFGEAVKLDGGEPDLYFNLGYAYWLDRETSSAISWLREAVRRNPADAEAHYVLGVALQASGSAAEGSREKELAKRLSTELAEFDARGGGLAAPRELERVRTDIDVPPALRLETTLVEAGQRDQQALATFHLEAGRRFFATARDAEAIAALRRAVYLAPYQSEAHLLLGRLYLRGGRLGEAIDALKISVWSEDTIAARLALAEAYLASRDEAGARAELEFVLGRDAGNEDARRLLDRLP